MAYDAEMTALRVQTLTLYFRGEFTVFHPTLPEAAERITLVTLRYPWETTDTHYTFRGEEFDQFVDILWHGTALAAHKGMRRHQEEVGVIGLDDAMLVVTNTAGLREDLQQMLMQYYARMRDPEVPRPDVHPVGDVGLAIGAYGISGCPAAVAVSTGADGGYNVQFEYERDDQAPRPWMARYGERLVIDITD